MSFASAVVDILSDFHTLLHLDIGFASNCWFDQHKQEDLGHVFQQLASKAG